MFQCNRLFLVISLIVQTLCCQGQKDRDYWIERYLSVSYPLQHIKVTSHVMSSRLVRMDVPGVMLF